MSLTLVVFIPIELSSTSKTVINKILKLTAFELVDLNVLVDIASLRHEFNQLGLVFHVDLVEGPRCLLELVCREGWLIFNVMFALVLTRARQIKLAFRGVLAHDMVRPNLLQTFLVALYDDLTQVSLALLGGSLSVSC